MFDTKFPFQKRTSYGQDPNNPHILSRTIYTFTSSKGNRYLVYVDEHPHYLYVVKFCYHKHKNHPKKYHLLTNHNECGGVLRTVVEICLLILEQNPAASFAFIGVPKPSEDEKSQNNQRFRVYKRITETFLGPETFKHVESQDANGYLLINKEFKHLQEVIIQMLISIYQDLDYLLT